MGDYRVVASRWHPLGRAHASSATKSAAVIAGWLTRGKSDGTGSAASNQRADWRCSSPSRGSVSCAPGRVQEDFRSVGEQLEASNVVFSAAPEPIRSRDPSCLSRRSSGEPRRQPAASSLSHRLAGSLNGQQLIRFNAPGGLQYVRFDEVTPARENLYRVSCRLVAPILPRSSNSPGRAVACRTADWTTWWNIEALAEPGYRSVR
jgi:hypothetical protein